MEAHSLGHNFPKVFEAQNAAIADRLFFERHCLLHLMAQLPKSDVSPAVAKYAIQQRGGGAGGGTLAGGVADNSVEAAAAANAANVSAGPSAPATSTKYIDLLTILGLRPRNYAKPGGLSWVQTLFQDR